MVKAPLFPRYIFVRIDVTAQQWRVINSTFGVSQLVGHRGLPVAVTPGVIETLRLGQGADGQNVHYGVRPTDIRIVPAGQGIPARVIVVEPTGAETELLLQVGEANVIVVMLGRTTAQPDEMVGLEVDTGKAHLFDGATGLRLQ